MLKEYMAKESEVEAEVQQTEKVNTGPAFGRRLDSSGNTTALEYIEMKVPLP